MCKFFSLEMAGSEARKVTAKPRKMPVWGFFPPQPEFLTGFAFLPVTNDGPISARFWQMWESTDLDR
jgi:hypothetical protein